MNEQLLKVCRVEINPEVHKIFAEVKINGEEKPIRLTADYFFVDGKMKFKIASETAWIQEVLGLTKYNNLEFGFEKFQDLLEKFLG